MPGLGRGKRNPCKYLGKTRGPGKGFQGSPFSHVSFPAIDSEPEFAPFSPGVAHPYNDFYSLA